MPDLSRRSTAVEIMDDLECSGPVVDQTLRELNTINKWLGGDQISVKAFIRAIGNSQGPIKFMDLGCGGGDILIALAKWCRKHKKNVQFLGIDANNSIVEYARRNCEDYPEITFRCVNILEEEFESLKCDILHCCLFTHHFSDEQLIRLFSLFRRQTEKQVIINDLHRHNLAYYSILWLTKAFSRSEMVRHDAALSVARGFRRSELKEILHKASISQYHLRWKWAFRWRLVY